MTIWAAWLDGIRGLLDALSTEAGLGLGLAIIVATLLLRTVLLPFSWSIAYRGSIRQKRLVKLQPELQRLKEIHAHEPDVYARRFAALYREHGLTLVDGRSLLGALVQMPVLLGMFQVLRSIGDGARFLWVANLLKPDVALAVVAGLTTALMFFVNPDLPEQLRWFMIVVPSIIALVAALNFGSALAIYWAVSNCFSALQTVTAHYVIGRRIRAGTLAV